MVFLPFSAHTYRDGPPVGTMALGALCIAVFAGVRFDVVDPEAWSMDWTRIEPLDWVRSVFLHVGPLHLVGNLLFLWVFGQVVEGAVGTRAFLAWVLAVVVASGALESFAMRHAPEGSSFGASGLVYACIAAGPMLAPQTRIHLLPLRIGSEGAVVPILPLALGWIAFEAVFGFGVTGAEATRALAFPALLHLLGAGVGALLAWLGLRLGWLDAGGWDWFALRRRTRAKSLDGFVLPTESHRRPARDPSVPDCPACGRPRPREREHCLYCGAE